MNTTTTTTRPQHTPGPWIVRHLTGFPLQISTAPDVNGFGMPIADCSKRNLPAEALANARLIAAAPDLLEALKAMIAVWEGPRERAAMGFAQTVNLARAALAKVEG